MIFLSLWVTADAGGGLKIRAHQHPDLQGLGGGSHQQASDGIYRGIACRFCRTPSNTINYFVLFQPQFGQQARWGAYPEHLQFSRWFQNLPVYPRSQSSSDVCGQSLQIHLKHPEIRPSYCEDYELFSQPHYCRIAPPHPAFSTDSV